MKWKSLLLYLLIVSATGLSQNMLNLINYNRLNADLRPLNIIPNLMAAANDQANFMCEAGSLTHSNHNGNLKSRSIRNGFKGMKVAENIAKHKSENIDEVVNAWMSSKKHKNIILGNFLYTGIGTCLDKNGSRYWVQVFGSENPKKNNSDEDSQPISSSVDETIAVKPTKINTKKPKMANSSVCIETDSCDSQDKKSIKSNPIPPKDILYPNLLDGLKNPLNSVPIQMVYMILNSMIQPQSTKEVTQSTTSTLPPAPSYQVVTLTVPMPKQPNIISTMTESNQENSNNKKPKTEVITITATAPPSSTLPNNVINQYLTPENKKEVPKTLTETEKISSPVKTTITVTRRLPASTSLFPMTETVNVEKTVTVYRNYESQPVSSMNQSISVIQVEKTVTVQPRNRRCKQRRGSNKRKDSRSPSTEDISSKKNVTSPEDFIKNDESEDSYSEEDNSDSDLSQNEPNNIPEKPRTTGNRKVNKNKKKPQLLENNKIDIQKDKNQDSESDEDVSKPKSKKSKKLKKNRGPSSKTNKSNNEVDNSFSDDQDSESENLSNEKNNLDNKLKNNKKKIKRTKNKRKTKRATNNRKKLNNRGS